MLVYQSVSIKTASPCSLLRLLCSHPFLENRDSLTQPPEAAEEDHADSTLAAQLFQPRQALLTRLQMRVNSLEMDVFPKDAKTPQTKMQGIFKRD